MNSVSAQPFDRHLIQSLAELVSGIPGVAEAYLDRMPGLQLLALYAVVGKDYREEEVNATLIGAITKEHLENAPKMVLTLTGTNPELAKLRDRGCCVFKSDTVEIEKIPEKPWWKFW